MTARNTSTSPSAVSLFDARPFFEKALRFGLQSGILDQQSLETMGHDAPKGMVQIARYFGSEFLRPELEKAKDRMVNLVSLQLRQASGGDLRLAAEALRDHSFLSRSKGGSDMLKALIAMPQTSHFGMNENSGFTDEQIPLLAKWSLRSWDDYQSELARRSRVAQVIDAALWLADRLGLQADELVEAGKDAEAVIRTALLVLASRHTEMPDWVAFESMVSAMRKKYRTTNQPDNLTGFSITSPKDLPDHCKAAVEAVRLSVVTDLPKILDSDLTCKRLFDQTPAFMGRYFWLEDSLSEIDHHHRSASAAWDKATGGHHDDGSLLTLFLCLACGVPPKTLLTEKSAVTLIRRIRKTGLKPALARQYIEDHAPAQHQDDYARMWADFVDEAQPVFQSDFDASLVDALALLRHECNVK